MGLWALAFGLAPGLAAAASLPAAAAHLTAWPAPADAEVLRADRMDDSGLAAGAAACPACYEFGPALGPGWLASEAANAFNDHPGLLLSMRHTDNSNANSIFFYFFLKYRA